jgi:quinol-cytochrome oxidoreductase complex cytochrome b subunit/mono/diheme cytochrome c family protein
MRRTHILITIGILVFGGMFLSSVSVGTSTALQQTTATPIITIQITPTFNPARLDQPPTIVPPVQADNGAQVYWGMCMACHGDQGQGLTDEWRASFPLEDRDCWQSGCHGSDAPENSFEIPQTGIPALAGAGALSRFSNSFELYNHIHQNMPFFRADSLTSEEAWSLTAYVLQLNDRQTDGFTLNEINGSAISIHHKVKLPESEIPGALILVGVLILAAIGINIQSKQATLSARPNFFHHLHPPSIPAEQSRFRYTLGAGGAAVLLSFILLITGLLEMYYYVPTPGQAAISVETINTLVPFGSLIRNLHFWAAQFLVIVMTIHLLRVTLTGAYAPPRRFNHLLGMGLLVFILLLNFTGYVLRWDEGIHWALVVGANLLKTIPWVGDGLYYFVVGGTEPSAATLTRFYAWHIFGLTLGMIILIIWHAFRVRRDGGIAVPPPAERKEKERISRYDLLRREVLAMTITGVILLFFSLIVPAPIEQPISEVSVMTANSQAPWFFLWVQQLLKFGDPFLLGILVPVLVVIVLGLLPYVLPNAKREELGTWFPRGNRIAQVLAVLIMLAILVLTALGSILN